MRCLRSDCTLHSNLVIFKWSTEKGIISSCFTFQSGYIQIKLFNISFDKLLSFTFQSGYIQILFPIYWHYLLYFLYIPIWLYSNKPALLKATLRQLSLHSNLVIFKLIYTLYWYALCTCFTFQSGYIQIMPLLTIKPM